MTGLALCAFAVKGVHGGVDEADVNTGTALTPVVDPKLGVKTEEVLIADPGVVEKLISGVLESLSSKSIKSARTESVSFLGVVGARLGISCRKADGEAAGQWVGGPIDDLAGRRCCLDGVVGGREGTGSSSRNRPRRVVDDPFLASDFRLAKELFLGKGRSPGLVGRADLAGVNGMEGRKAGTGGSGYTGAGVGGGLSSVPLSRLRSYMKDPPRLLLFWSQEPPQRIHPPRCIRQPRPLTFWHFRYRRDLLLIHLHQIFHRRSPPLPILAFAALHAKFGSDAFSAFTG